LLKIEIAAVPARYASRKWETGHTFPTCSDQANSEQVATLGKTRHFIPLALVARCATIAFMSMSPISLRLDKDIRKMLASGRKRTLLKPAELIRRTLRAHLSEMIERESRPPRRITNVEPLPRGLMKRVYGEIAREGWDRVEAAATAAQPGPQMED